MEVQKTNNTAMRCIVGKLVEEGMQVVEEIPQRVTALDELLKSGKLDADKINFQDNGIVLPSLTSGQEMKSGDGDHAGHTLCGAKFPTNQMVVEIFQAVKPHLRKLVEDCDKIHDWISVLTPKKGITGEPLLEIKGDLEGICEKAVGLLENLITHFFNRSKAMSRLIKYPQVKDTLQHVKELDEEAIFTAKKSASHAKAFYTQIHKMATKIMDEVER